MLKQVLFFLIIPIASMIGSVLACEINLRDHYITIGHSNLVKESIPLLIKSSDCSPESILLVLRSLFEYQGSMRTSSLISVNQFEDIKLTPEKIKISSISDLIREKTSTLVNDTIIEFERSTAMSSLIALSSNDFFTLHCTQGCDQSRDKLQIMLSLSQGTEGGVLRTEKLSFKKTFRTPILQAKAPIGQLEREQLVGKFERGFIYTDGPELYSVKESDLKNYTLNKTMSAGQILKTVDLSPKQLVLTGQLVKLIISDGQLELTTKGTAKKNGAYGDSIEVLPLGSKSTIIGKIEDTNFVRVIQ